MLHKSQPLITNLFKNVNLLFLISYIVGKLSFSILIKKHTFEHIYQGRVISAQKLISKTMIFPIFPWQQAILL